MFLLDGEKVGIIGGLHPAERKKVDLKETYVAELNLNAIINATTEALVYSPVPRFPEITRDIALELDRTKPAGEIESIIRKCRYEAIKRSKSIRRI